MWEWPEKRKSKSVKRRMVDFVSRIGMALSVQPRTASKTLLNISLIIIGSLAGPDAEGIRDPQLPAACSYATCETPMKSVTVEYSRPKVSLGTLRGPQRGLGLEYSTAYCFYYSLRVKKKISILKGIP